MWQLHNPFYVETSIIVIFTRAIRQILGAARDYVHAR